MAVQDLKMSAEQSPNRGLCPTHLQAPDPLTLFGDIFHCLAHQGNEHVEEEDEGEDDIGDEQEEKEDGVGGVLLNVQVAQTYGELEELQHRVAEAAVRAAVLLVFGALLNQRGQRWGTKRMTLGSLVAGYSENSCVCMCALLPPSFWQLSSHLSSSPSHEAGFPAEPPEIPFCQLKCALFSPPLPPAWLSLIRILPWL